MRNFFVTLMASLLSCSAAFAFWPEATDSSLEIGVGYRQDRLEWKTSSQLNSSYYNYSDYDGSDTFLGPPIGLSSKLKWRDLQIWQIEATGKYVTCDNLYLRANGDYGWITSGKNRDSDSITFGRDNGSDYYGSGNEFEFAHSKSKAKGHVYDARIAVGYQFKWCDDSFSIAPLVGYSWHGQHIQDNHLRQNFYVGDEAVALDDTALAGARYRYSDDYYFESYCSDYSYSSYSSGGRNSTYHTRWNGPFLGFDFDYRFGFGCGCELDWQIFGTYEFHWAEYHANAKWHLRSDFRDGFHHHAKNAYGNIFDIGVKWDFCECWTLAVKGEFQWWWADRGHDRARFARNQFGNVQTDCYLKIPLRDVKWESAAVTLDLGMVF